MTLSQNGFTALTSPPSGTLKWITGRVAPGDVQTVFDYLCKRFDAGVEKIRPDWSWGWAYRPIRGSSTTSNHASGTAIDLNAPAHPLGVANTFTTAEQARIRSILRDLNGSLRWGGDYSSRKDDMHFEVDVSAATLAAVARNIRANKLPGLKPDWTPKLAKAVYFGVIQEQFLIAAGHSEGKITRHNGVGIIQKALNKVLDGKDVDVDGYVGKATLEAWKRWEDKTGVGLGRPRIPDRRTIELLAEKADFDVKGLDK